MSFPAKADQPFEVRVRQPGELRMGPGATRISIDSGDGAVLRVIDPVRAKGGDKFISWLFPLHTGRSVRHRRARVHQPVRPGAAGVLRDGAGGVAETTKKAGDEASTGCCCTQQDPRDRSLIGRVDVSQT